MGSVFLLKGVLAETADGALEVLGQILEGGAGGDAVIGDNTITKSSHKPTKRLVGI